MGPASPSGDSEDRRAYRKHCGFAVVGGTAVDWRESSLHGVVVLRDQDDKDVWPAQHYGGCCRCEGRWLGWTVAEPGNREPSADTRGCGNVAALGRRGAR